MSTAGVPGAGAHVMLLLATSTETSKMLGANIAVHWMFVNSG